MNSKPATAERMSRAAANSPTQARRPVARRVHIDAIDCRILGHLQRDIEQHVGQIAAAVALSESACWRRIERLQNTGVVAAKVALLDPVKLNVGLNVFVRIRTRSHAPSDIDRFCSAVAAMPEIVQMFRVQDSTAYLLRVVVPDVWAYNAVYRRLTEAGDLQDVHSSFALEQAKYTSELPLHYMLPAGADTHVE